jgi:hypothetical protein
MLLSDVLNSFRKFVFQKLGINSRREKGSVGLFLIAFFNVFSNLSEWKSSVHSFLTLNNPLALSDNRFNAVPKYVLHKSCKNTGILNSSTLEQTTKSDDTP